MYGPSRARWARGNGRRSSVASCLAAGVILIGATGCAVPRTTPPIIASPSGAGPTAGFTQLAIPSTAQAPTSVPTRTSALGRSSGSLLVLDAVEACTSGGPDRDNNVEAGVALAGVDRIAVDAVGVAILRQLGTTPEVELGLGVAQPEAIALLADDADGRAYADGLRLILEGGGE